MAIIQHNTEIPAARVEVLHPSRDVVHLSKPTEQRLCLFPEHGADRKRGQRIIDHEFPRHMQRDRPRFFTHPQGELAAIGVQADVLRAHLRLWGASIGAKLARHIIPHAPSICIVHIDGRLGTMPEQDRLCKEVVLKVPVEIQVILRKVGEYAARKGDAVHAIQI